MEEPPEVEQWFISLLTTHQGQLRGYIQASLGDYSNSLDVLQRTNLTIWKKADEFRRDAPFLPWAFGIARYVVLGFIRDRSRESIIFHSDVVELMSDVNKESFETFATRQKALHECLTRLDEKNQRLFQLRYNEGRSIREIAEATGRTGDSVKSVMMRSRQLLRNCINQMLLKLA